jgi:lysophospholipase L1-like esterase
VGDSITRGVGAKISWPDQIAAMLGDRWKVENKVHPNTEGATLIAEAVFKGLTGKPAPVPAGK